MTALLSNISMCFLRMADPPCIVAEAELRRLMTALLSNISMCFLRMADPPCIVAEAELHRPTNSRKSKV